MIKTVIIDRKAYNIQFNVVGDMVYAEFSEYVREGGAAKSIRANNLEVSGNISFDFPATRISTDYAYSEELKREVKTETVVPITPANWQYYKYRNFVRTGTINAKPSDGACAKIVEAIRAAAVELINSPGVRTEGQRKALSSEIGSLNSQISGLEGEIRKLQAEKIRKEAELESLI